MAVPLSTISQTSHTCFIVKKINNLRARLAAGICGGCGATRIPTATVTTPLGVIDWSK